ncbi:MAG: hypothetical protein Q7K54_05550 [Candidatus Parcubacteria bacterium]|nr:hypothetical protein [Candidatus Parcubacteria bacterium]
MTSNSAIRKIIHLTGVCDEAKLRAIEFIIDGVPQNLVLDMMGIHYKRIHPDVDKHRLELELLPLLQETNKPVLEPSV